MSDQSKGHKRSKNAVLADWGNSLLNKLPAIARRRRKRQVDKARRQQEKAELRKEID